LSQARSRGAALPEPLRNDPDNRLVELKLPLIASLKRLLVKSAHDL
jgi:hypothetical protein